MKRVIVPSAMLLSAAVLAVAAMPTSSRAQGTSAAMAGAPLLPPNAKPGECFTRVYLPPVYETVAEKVVKKAPAEKIDVTPPRFETVEEKVLVKEESEKIEIIPATFKEVEEKVLVKPEAEELVAVPAEYEEVEERVLIAAGYTTWKTDCGPLEKVATTTGETLCLVDVPAEYKTVKKRVVKSPARTEVVKKPAEYKTIKKQVVDKPATTKTVKVPSEYTTIKVQKLVEPAKETRTPIAEEFETVTKTVKKSDASVEWRQILCQANITPDLVERIQTALREAGSYKGPIDGSFGPGTLSAITAYQKSKGLPSGQVTIETLRSLNITF